MQLIFLHGLPGVGKLTVARELSKLTGFKVFHNHLTVDLVHSVFEFGSPAFVELREKLWLEVFGRAVEEKLDGLIFTFAFERSVRDGFVGNVRRTIESNGGEVLFVELKCSEDELEQRLTGPSRRAFGKLTSPAHLREMSAAGVFDQPKAPEDRLVLDTTHLSASASAARIVEEFGLGNLTG